MLNKQDEQGRIASDYAVITPTYGRDYKSRKEVEAAFKEGYDFELQPQGAKINIQQFAPGVKVEIRYKQLASVFIFTVPEGFESAKPKERHEAFLAGMRKTRKSSR